MKNEYSYKPFNSDSFKENDEIKKKPFSIKIFIFGALIGLILMFPIFIFLYDFGIVKSNEYVIVSDGEKIEIYDEGFYFGKKSNIFHCEKSTTVNFESNVKFINGFSSTLYGTFKYSLPSDEKSISNIFYNTQALSNKEILKKTPTDRCSEVIKFYITQRLYIDALDKKHLKDGNGMNNYDTEGIKNELNHIFNGNLNIKIEDITLIKHHKTL